jgi:hypothetical protein
MTCDPQRVTPFPSSNGNRVRFLGIDSELTAAFIDQIVQHYRDAGVDRWFVQLDSVPDIDRIATLLVDAGLKSFTGTTYPTLVRSVDATPPQAPTDLQVRRLTPIETAAHAEQLTTILGGKPYLQLARRDGVDCFAAFDGPTPVSAALLATLDKTAYLGFAATLKPHRNRGGQSALIAARLARAAELNATVAVAETLGMLRTSLGNLRRMGFDHLYDKSTWCWKA